jgi:hypothetical protein
VEWFRLYGEFATDPKVQMLSEALQRRLVMLFCLECSNGIETFHVTEREAAIAFALRVSEADIADTKAVFLAKGFINEDWTIRNWSTRQYESDSSTTRVRAWREKKKLEAQQAKQAQQSETSPKRSSNAPEQNRTDTEQIPPPSAHEAFDSRTKFAMTQEWEPNEQSFAAVLTMNGLDGHVFEQAELLEFKSFWIATPDEYRTQAKWEHALAQHLKRGLRHDQAAGRTKHAASQSGSPQNTQDHQGRGSQDRNPRPNRPSALAAPDRVRAAIAERDTAQNLAGQALDQDG